MSNVPWKKLGRMFVPSGQPEWMASYAQVPFAEPLGDRRYRIYFGVRDRDNRSRVGWLEVDLRDPLTVLSVSQRPALDLGRRGCFDDNGVTPSWIVDRGAEKFLYYFGWNRGTTVAFHIYIGLAVSLDGGETFERIQETPILDRLPAEPFLASNPCVLREGDSWKMWYVSSLAYDVEMKGQYYPRYHLKSASSEDGIHWRREGQIAIGFEHPGEYAISRPCILRRKSGYELWYSWKGDAYRIGMARSPDAVNWTRCDTSTGINVSPSGWDAEMIAYPHLFSDGGSEFLLYNGNECGKTGFGLAVRQECDSL